MKAARVLCVEDDASIVELIGYVLAADPGVTLLVARDGIQGLRLALEQRPDLVLLDLNVGGIGGEEILRTLRSAANTVPVPVVILTADADPATAARLLRAGADAVVSKPFHPERLGDLVDEMLTFRHPSSNPIPYSADDLRQGPLDEAMVAALVDLDEASKDRNGIGRLVRSAMADAHVGLQSLEAAASRRNADEVIRLAHALRGTLANLGAHVVAQRCHDLETTARAGDMAGITEALTHVTSAVAEAEHVLLRRFPSDRT